MIEKSFEFCIGWTNENTKNRRRKMMRSNKQKIYVINFKDKNKQIIYKKKQENNGDDKRKR